MDSLSPSSTALRYESIPDSQGVQTPPQLVPGTSQSPVRRLISGLRSSFSGLGFRFSRVPLAAAIALAALFFVSDRYVLVRQDRGFWANHVFTRTGSAAEDWRSPNLQAGQGIVSAASSKLHGLFAHTNPFRSYSRREQSSVSCGDLGDFVKEERVPTGDCSGGRYCRARLIVTKEGQEATVAVGYHISGVEGTTSVDSSTQARVAAVTQEEAEQWATELLGLASEELIQVNCAVTSAMVAQAIMDTKDTAASCPNTADPRCESLVTVKNCTVPEPSGVTEKQKRCHEFLKLGSSNVTYEDMGNSDCENLEFSYNRLGMEVPFCEQDCEGKPCPQTVYATMTIQSNFRGPDPRSCLSALYVPVFQTIRATIPKCNHIPSDKIERYHRGTLDLVTLKDYRRSSLPPALFQIAVQGGCQLTYVYFEAVPSFTALVNSVC